MRLSAASELQMARSSERGEKAMFVLAFSCYLEDEHDGKS